MSKDTDQQEKNPLVGFGTPLKRSSLLMEIKEKAHEWAANYPLGGGMDSVASDELYNMCMEFDKEVNVNNKNWRSKMTEAKSILKELVEEHTYMIDPYSMFEDQAWCNMCGAKWGPDDEWIHKDSCIWKRMLELLDTDDPCLI